MDSTAYSTWIELSRTAFRHNCSIIAQACGGASWGAVVKANAYGHGIREIVELTRSYAAIGWLFVSSNEEALLTRSLGWQGEILSMSHVTTHVHDALRNNIILAVYDRQGADIIEGIARSMELRARVHVYLDAGMHHLGFPLSTSRAHIEALMQSPWLRIEGVFGHLADTSNTDDVIVREDAARFACATEWLSVHGIVRHIGASGSVWMRGASDLYRIGTMLYGSWKSPVHCERVQRLVPSATLRPVATLKTRLLYVKTVCIGETVGYNRAFRATRDMSVGIAGAGYCEGFARANSHKGVVLVRGVPCPVVGIVGMNMIAIDVTTVTSVRQGDEVTLIGEHSDVTPGAIAVRLDTNPNEITAAMAAHIPRIVRDDLEDRTW